MWKAHEANKQNIHNSKPNIMKAFKKISVVLLVIGIVVATFIACSKEKEEANLQPMIEQGTKTPIATFHKETGRMEYFIDLKQIQSALNYSTSAKDNEQFIVESCQIIDDDNSNIPLSFKYTILDSESETSISMFLIDFYLDKEIEQNQINYYIKQEIQIGNYYFALQNELGGYSIINVHNRSIESIDEWDNSEMVPPHVVALCIGHNCLSGCDLVNMQENTFDCTKCKHDPEATEWYCEKRSGLSNSQVVSVLNSGNPNAQ